MLNLQKTTAFLFESPQVEILNKDLGEILNEIIGPSFEDTEDFLSWAKDSLPLVYWRKQASSRGEISIFLFFCSSSETYAEYFFNALRKKLTRIEEIPSLTFRHHNLILKNSFKKFSLVEIKLFLEMSPKAAQILHLLPHLIEEILFEIKSSFHEQYFLQSKHLLIQQMILKIKRRFNSRIDEYIFEESKRFLTLAENKFVEQRSCHLISHLILSQYSIRKALLKAISYNSYSRHVYCRILPSHLSSPFTSKFVFGIFVGINFLHKYDSFSEEHLIRALEKLSINAQSVADSVYSFHKYGEPFKFLYIEIEKKEGKYLTLKERKKLCIDLKEVLKKSVERLQPSVYMLNHEEDTIKNVLLLNREIRLVSDLPQVMIHFEEQTDKDICFRILLVCICEQDLLLQKSFENQNAIYLPSWTQIVRYLRKKYLIQAHLFKLRLRKVSNMLRSDASLNFYVARQRICEILYQTIGEFRDFNGGIILKQGEILTQFKQFFHECSCELLENFFYNIVPLEIQATIPLPCLTGLFQLFLQGKNYNFAHSQDHLIKFQRQGDHTFFLFQAKEPTLVESIKIALNQLKINPKNLVTVPLVEEDRSSLSCIFKNEVDAKHREFIHHLQKSAKFLKRKFQKMKTLRLAISSNPSPLDPRIKGDEDTKTLLKMLFEGLMRINSSGKVIFGMARKVTISIDRKRYIFQLRSTVWSNGTPVTAYDFIYAWKTTLSPHFKAPSAYLFYPLKNAREIKEGNLPPETLGVKALERDKLEIELNHPVPYFLELLAQPQFSPINQVMDQSQPTWPYQEGEKYVCNGAFLLKKNNVSQGYELIKNPLYHDCLNIHLDRVLIKNAQQDEIKRMFSRDEIDWLGFPIAGTMDLSSLPLKQGETLILPNDSLYWYVFNTRCFPFNNIKMRQAFAFTVNRAHILQNIQPGYWPAFNILAFQHSHGILMEESQRKGMELFEEALKELGIQKKSFPVVKLFHVIGKTRNNIAKILKETWEEIFKIQCQIETLSWNEIFNRLIIGDFQICGINWINLIGDPSYTLQIFHSSSKFINFPRWSHEKYEKLLERAYCSKRHAKRYYYYALAEEILLREAPVIPLTRVLPCSIKKDRVEILNHSAVKSWDFKWANINNS